jgi:hypothetical protein
MNKGVDTPPTCFNVYNPETILWESADKLQDHQIQDHDHQIQVKQIYKILKTT